MRALSVRWATEAEIEQWDELVAANPAGGDFLLARAYAETKKLVGWRPRYLVFERDGGVTDAALVLERRVPLLGKLWYLTRGPGVAEVSALKERLAVLRDFIRAHERGVFAATMEPPVVATDEALAELDADPSLRDLGCVMGDMIQPNGCTAIVDVAKDDDELMAGFQARNRTKIRRAIRDGAEVREYPATEETFAQMYRLQGMVGGGKDGIVLRSPEYARSIWRRFSEAGQGWFFGIDVDGGPALMAYLIQIGDRAYYKDGGSERDRVSQGMSNLLQWHMMRFARDRGATSYDLIGVAPEWAQSIDDHPAYSLTSFKLAFSRERTEHLKSIDLVLRPRAYALWTRFGERIVTAIHRRRLHDPSLY